MNPDHNRYDAQQTPLLHKYRQLEINDWKAERDRIVAHSKAAQKNYEIDRTEYRLNHGITQNLVADHMWQVRNEKVAQTC